VGTEREAAQETVAAAKDQRGNIEKLKRQKDVTLLLYAAFAYSALAEFSPEHR